MLPSKVITKTSPVKEGVPTDNLKMDLHNIIRKGAEKLYDDVIMLIINPVFVPRDFFVERMFNAFIKHVGESFEDFIKKYKLEIYEEGVDVLATIEGLINEDINPAYTGETVWCKHGCKKYDMGISHFIWRTLANLGFREGFLIMNDQDFYLKMDPEDTGGILCNYIEGLQNKESLNNFKQKVFQVINGGGI
jgi:hypothetical protein